MSSTDTYQEYLKGKREREKAEEKEKPVEEILTIEMERGLVETLILLIHESLPRYGIKGQALLCKEDSRLREVYDE